jgi:hypothetical protein
MGSIESTLGVLSFMGAVLGLITAIINRKKIIEIRHTTNYTYDRGDAFNKKWYDSYLWLFIWILFFFPIGYYGLYKSRTVSKGWKIIIPVIHFSLLVAGSK